MVNIIFSILSLLLLNPAQVEASFTDIEPGHPDYEAVQYLEDQTYRSEEKITSAEFLKVINNSLLDGLQVYRSDCFIDIQDHSLAHYNCYANNLNVVSGYYDETFPPNQNITFIETAKINVNILGFKVEDDPVWFRPYLKILVQENAIPSTLTDIETEVTREEVAEIVYHILNVENLNDSSVQENNPQIYSQNPDNEIAAIPVKRNIPPNAKLIALTYDDGPNETYTPRLLNILKKMNVPATFYILGRDIAGNEDIIKRIVNEGHELGNHAWTHRDLTILSAKEIKKEVEGVDDEIKKIVGFIPLTMRAPYGSLDQNVKDNVGKPIIDWTIDPKDWRNNSYSTFTADYCISRARDDAIILLHDVNKIGIGATPFIVTKLRDEGYTFVTISELFGFAENPDLAVPGKYYVK